MAKILANAFVHDFNQEKFDWNYDEGRIGDLLATLEKRRHPTRVPGVTEDDVVSFWDYLIRHAESQRRFALHYWPQAVNPRSVADHRRSRPAVLDAVGRSA
jgi:hypothetical protein